MGKKSCELLVLDADSQYTDLPLYLEELQALAETNQVEPIYPEINKYIYIYQKEIAKSNIARCLGVKKKIIGFIPVRHIQRSTQQ